MNLPEFCPIPACGAVVEPVRRWVDGFAPIFEVRYVEHRQGVVDVARHGMVAVVSVRVDGERPVVHQARDHVRCEGDDHCLCERETENSAYCECGRYFKRSDSDNITSQHQIITMKPTGLSAMCVTNVH